MKIAVVIPVYKNPDECEIISLFQCCKVLGGYDVYLVAPENFDARFFCSVFSTFGVRYKEAFFPALYFKNIQGYNRLLLSKVFSQRFCEYDYMLIYQLDAYLFEDKLELWCFVGYDYIGAPLFDNKFYPNFGRVGNGGFSLRRVGAYLDFFKGNKNVFRNSDLADRIALKKKPQTRWLIWLLMAMGWRNKPRSVAKHWQYNEDTFWSVVLADSNYALKKPSVLDALHFAFERFPSEAYRLTGELPFGCHAWKKYQYEEFWSEYIDIDME